MSIQVHNFNFSYNQKPFLKNLCFSCPGGQVVALLGENGSGKSTLISCLAGMKSVRGINWMNRPLQDWSIADRAKHRALVPQHSIFEPSMILYDFVLLGRKPWFRWYEGPGDHSVVREVLNLFELTHLSFRPLADVSGGERQKAVLARAFAQDTPLLLLDEPLNNLDLRFQMKFMNLLKERSQSKNVLILIALHDINAALSWCDSAILLKDGSLVAQGPNNESISEESVHQMLDIRIDFVEINGKRQMFLPLEEVSS